MTSPPLSILTTSSTTDGYATPRSTSILLNDGKDARKPVLNDVHPVLLLSDEDDVVFVGDYDDGALTHIKYKNYNCSNKRTSLETKMTCKTGSRPLFYEGAKPNGNTYI